jgi:hypothetical protein
VMDDWGVSDKTLRDPTTWTLDQMGLDGIDALTNNGPAHVLVLVMEPISYARHRFRSNVIRHAV